MFKAMEGQLMQIQLKADTKKLTKHLSFIQKQQVPFATSNALNAVAFDARSAIQTALPNKLHRPTKGLIKSVIVEKSKKKHLIARVGFVGKGFGKSLWSESPAVIMARLISGGLRKPRGRAIIVPVVKNIKLNKLFLQVPWQFMVSPCLIPTSLANLTISTSTAVPNT
jgi:hypothetical protein